MVNPIHTVLTAKSGVKNFDRHFTAKFCRLKQQFLIIGTIQFQKKKPDTYSVLHHCSGISTDTDACTNTSISETLQLTHLCVMHTRAQLCETTNQEGIELLNVKF